MPRDYSGPKLLPRSQATLEVFPGDRYPGGKAKISLVTDADGRFMAPLPSGRYCLVRAGRGAKPTGPVGQYEDRACMIQRWETCDAVVDVPVKAAIAIDIYEPCSWSICYMGPPPP